MLRPTALFHAWPEEVLCPNRRQSSAPAKTGVKESRQVRKPENSSVKRYIISVKASTGQPPQNRPSSSDCRRPVALGWIWARRAKAKRRQALRKKPTRIIEKDRVTRIVSLLPGDLERLRVRSRKKAVPQLRTQLCRDRLEPQRAIGDQRRVAGQRKKQAPRGGRPRQPNHFDHNIDENR
jgi:hypothetical protein